MVIVVLIIYKSTRNIQWVKWKQKTRTQTIRICNHDIRIEFGMLIIKSGKMQIKEGIEFPNQKRFRTLGEKENNKYLGILKVDGIKQLKEEKIENLPQTNEKNSQKQSSVAEISSMA